MRPPSPSQSANLCSVPPKADADSKDASASKADDDEKPKPASERVQEAVRDSKVNVLALFWGISPNVVLSGHTRLPV